MAKKIRDYAMFKKPLSPKVVRSKKFSNGYQFICIQSTPYIENFAGFWILKDVELIT